MDLFINYEIGLKYFPVPSLVDSYDLMMISQFLISFLCQRKKRKKKRKERKREVILTAFFNERRWLFHLCRFSYEWRWEKEKFISLVAHDSCLTHLRLNKFGVVFASKKLEHKNLLTNMSLRSSSYQTVGNFMIYFASGQWY